MEESKPESVPVEFSKSIYPMIKGSEPVSFAHVLKNENSKNVQYHSDSQGDNGSLIFEDSSLGMKYKQTKHIETDDNEITFHNSQHIPISCSIHNREVTSLVSAPIDYEYNNPEESRTCSSSSLTTQCIYDLESSSSTDNDTLSLDISNVRRSHPSMYSLANDRLPMADLYSQYHVVSRHGYNTSSSSIDTSDTRSSTPTFQSHASALTSDSSSNLYFTSEFGQMEKDRNSKKRTVCGSYDVKSHHMDSDISTDIALEDIMLTSLRPFESPIICDGESNLKVSNREERQSKTHVPNPLTLKPPSPEPPPLPASKPPQTPPSPPLLHTFELKGNDSTSTTQVNGNHVVQNMSNEMYKTMKKAITPGKVYELRKVFAGFFHDKNVENLFLPVQHQQVEKQVKTVEIFDSVSHVTAGDALPDCNNDEARVGKIEENTENVMKEKTYEEEGSERVGKKENLVAFDGENSCPMPQESKLSQEQIQSLEQQKQERNQQQLQKLEVQVVKQLLPKTTSEGSGYFTDGEPESVGNNGVTHTTPGWPVTNSHTQEDHVSITNTAAINTKPAMVIMTPTANKVGEGVSKVSREIISASVAPLLLPPAKTEFIETETICKSEEGAELSQEAELITRESELEEQNGEERKQNENEREVGQEERDEENKNPEWKWEAESGIDLNSVCVEAESAAVEEGEEREEKIVGKKHWSEKSEGKDKDMKNSNEEKKEETWKKGTEEKVQQGEKGMEQTGKYEKQLSEMEGNVTKEIESLVDSTTNRKIDEKSDSDERIAQLQTNISSTDTLLCSSSPERSMMILLDETPDSLEKSLIIEDEVRPENTEAVESTPTTCIQPFSFSQADYCETLTTTSTIEPSTATTTVLNEASHMSDTPRCFVNSSALVDYNNYNPVVATAAEENINSACVAVLTGQTSAIEKIPTTVSQVVNVTSTIVSPAAVLQPFPTINEGKGLLSDDELCSSRNLQLEVAAVDNVDENSKRLQKPQLHMKDHKPEARIISEDEWKDSNSDNDNGKENEESKRIRAKEIEADGPVSLGKITDVKKVPDENKRKDDEIGDRNNQCKESIGEGRKRFSAIGRSNSSVVPAKKVYSLPRTHSMDKLRARPLTVDPATPTSNNEGVTGVNLPFKALRQMFEEGRPLKIDDDDEKDLPPSIKTHIYPTNMYAADQSNTEETKSMLYPGALHKESYVTRKTPSITTKSRDVYLSKQSTTKINRSEATCKTATTTTTRMTTTAAPITANINQLSPKASTTRLLSSTTPDGWSGETKVETTVQNANTESSVLKTDVSCSNPDCAAISTPYFAEVPLELASIGKIDSYTTYDGNGYGTGFKDLKVAKPARTSVLEDNAQALHITLLKTVPSTTQDNRFQLKHEESKTLKRDNDSQSNMDLRNGHGYAPVEKVSSFRIRTHHAETDNKANIDVATLSSNTCTAETLLPCDDKFAVRKQTIIDSKTTEDRNSQSISITGEYNQHEGVSKSPFSKTNIDCNQYVSQIGVNSTHLVPEPAQNILFLGSKEELFAQNNSPKVTDSITTGTDLAPVNLYQQDSSFGAMVSGNTTLTRDLPISTSVMTPVISTVFTNVHLTPLSSTVELSDANSGQVTAHVNILSTNEVRQTVIEATPPPPAQFVSEVDVDKNKALNEAINTTAYTVGVDSASQNTLSNNNKGTTIDSVSVSSPGIQYYSDSQSSTDAWQTTLNSTTLYTTLAPVATGLTSYDQCGLSSTWNAGIPMAQHTHHQQQQQQQRQEVMQQDLISSPTPSSVYVGSKECTEKLRDETSTHVQGNVFRRIEEFEKTPGDPNFEKQKSHIFRGGKTVDLSGKQDEDAETTYERVKRNLRPIPAKNDHHLNLNSSTIPSLDSSLEDSSHIHDMSSLRSSQTPSYYSVNDSIGSFPDDNEDQNVVNEVNSDHQYAVVRLTPSNTDYNKVKHTIYCEVSGSGIKNETSSSFNLMRQRSDLSNMSFSTPSTAASDTEDELSDVNDARSDKQNLKKTSRSIHKNIVSVSKQRTTEMAETDLMKTSTYKTEKNIFLNSTQSPKSGDHKLHHTSETAIDSGTGTEIISSEGEAESQETTETWCEYQSIPYENYEQISKSGQSISINTTDACLRSRPSSLSVSSSSQITTTTTATVTTATATHYQMNTQPLKLGKSIQPSDFDTAPSSTKNDPNQIYEVHTEPETVSQEGEEDLRIVRGRLLIKNTIDSPKDGDDFDDNINVFAEEFHLDKENPLYQSDPDIYKHTEEEEEENDFIEEWSEDITFDQVDSMAKNHKISTEVMKTEAKGKQKLSNMLLSRLSKLDSKDIKQSINVEHHHEEIYGDIDFIHADGTKASSDYTENFDSIAENVELLMKSGKAVIVIKVIAERIVPIDYEFNVWRKSSAIVTRQIELDLLANEQRKRLYNHVMENAGGQQAIEPKRYGSYLERTQGSHETVLNSRETFRLFNQLLTVAENSGEGGDQNETYSERTERLALQRPSISDFMY